MNCRIFSVRFSASWERMKRNHLVSADLRSLLAIVLDPTGRDELIPVSFKRLIRDPQPSEEHRHAHLEPLGVPCPTPQVNEVHPKGLGGRIKVVGREPISEGCQLPHEVYVYRFLGFRLDCFCDRHDRLLRCLRWRRRRCDRCLSSYESISPAGRFKPAHHRTPARRF